jgi:hypothetical protein
MRRHLFAGVCLLFVSALGHAQTSPIWFKVATEDQSISVVLPAGTIYRLGSGDCWSDPVTVSAVTTLRTYWPSGDYPFADPCPGVAKELDIQETATAQIVTVGADAVTVPSLPAPAPPPTTTPAPTPDPTPTTTPAPTPTPTPAPATPTVTATYTCRVRMYSDGSYTADNCTAVN